MLTTELKAFSLILEGSLVYLGLLLGGSFDDKARERRFAIYMGLQRSAYCRFSCCLDFFQWG